MNNKFQSFEINIWTESHLVHVSCMWTVLKENDWLFVWGVKSKWTKVVFYYNKDRIYDLEIDDPRFNGLELFVLFVMYMWLFINSLMLLQAFN